MNARALLGIALCAVIVSAAACASIRLAGRPPELPGPPEAAPEPAPLIVPGAPSGDGFTIARTALRLQGIPYRIGGTDTHGFDCSGFVQYVFGLYGMALPRVVRDQYRTGRHIGLDDLEPGDLVFFSTQGDDVSHVGIVIGGDRFVHAPNSRGVVRVDSLTSAYWGGHVVGARRMSGS